MNTSQLLVDNSINFGRIYMRIFTKDQLAYITNLQKQNIATNYGRTQIFLKVQSIGGVRECDSTI